jgi:hypothetical protein
MASAGVWLHTRYMRTDSSATPSSKTSPTFKCGRTRNSSYLDLPPHSAHPHHTSATAEGGWLRESRVPQTSLTNDATMEEPHRWLMKALPHPARFRADSCFPLRRLLRWPPWRRRFLPTAFPQASSLCWTGTVTLAFSFGRSKRRGLGLWRIFRSGFGPLRSAGACRGGRHGLGNNGVRVIKS